MSTTTRTRRPRPKLVTLTDAAAERVAEILEERGEGYLRVGVTNGGCAGMEYLMDYVTEPEKFDEVVEDKGVQIVVDAKRQDDQFTPDADRNGSHQQHDQALDERDVEHRQQSAHDHHGDAHPENDLDDDGRDHFFKRQIFLHGSPL